MIFTQIAHLYIFLTRNIFFKPFSAGYSHRDIDYNVVKLCFQAIIIGSQAGQFYQLEPVVSDNVPDKSEYCDFNQILSIYIFKYRIFFSEMMTGLMIYKLSHASAPITGSTEIILLCDKVMKGKIT